MEKLGFLSLAIEQVGEYAQNRMKSVGECSQIFEESPNTLLDYRGIQTGATDRTVLAMWRAAYLEVRT